MTTMNDVVAFLLGEGELDGFWFGEKHERKRGSFWWREYLREAYSAHLAKGAQEWQPIETAPKDGSLVLLCTRSGNPRRICMAKYAEEGSSYPWRVDQTNYHLHTADLTYWMPLPAAPMLSQRGEVES